LASSARVDAKGKEVRDKQKKKARKKKRKEKNLYILFRSGRTKSAD